MTTPCNSLDISQPGLVKFDGTSTFTGVTLSQYNTLVGASSNGITSIDPGSTGYVLTSNGASANPSYQVLSSALIVKKVTLTSAQIKALHATPIEIIAAPGAGNGIQIVSYSAKFSYGGTNAFVAGAGQSIALMFNNNTTQIIAGNAFINNTMITGTSTTYSWQNQTSATTFIGEVAGVLDNVNIAAYNPVATEISGNAANNNTIDIIIGYHLFSF